MGGHCATRAAWLSTGGGPQSVAAALRVPQGGSRLGHRVRSSRLRHARKAAPHVEPAVREERGAHHEQAEQTDKHDDAHCDLLAGDEGLLGVRIRAAVKQAASRPTSSAAGRAYAPSWTTKVPTWGPSAEGGQAHPRRPSRRAPCAGRHLCSSSRCQCCWWGHKG